MRAIATDLGVAACIVENEKILLVKESRGSKAGLWGMPKGAVDEGEAPAKAVLRELREECGIDGKVVRLLCVNGKPDRDPRGHVVSIAYLVAAFDEPVAGDDAASAEWHKIAEVEELAGDHMSMLEKIKHF